MKEDIENGQMTHEGNGKNEHRHGGLTIHSTASEQPSKWEEARIVGGETRIAQRKYEEGILTVNEREGQGE